MVRRLFRTGARSQTPGSEEGRVGEEGRSRWVPDHLKKKKRDRVVPSCFKESKNAETFQYVLPYNIGRVETRCCTQRSTSRHAAPRRTVSYGSTPCADTM